MVGSGVGALDVTTQWLGLSTRVARGLQIGLLEARVHPAGIGDLELGVQVLLVVDGVDEAVQSFTGLHVRAVGDHLDGVAGIEVRKVDTESTEVRGGIEFAAVPG